LLNGESMPADGVVAFRARNPVPATLPSGPQPAGDLPALVAANRRYFIVTHGRSGSSFLSAILAECGASFGPSCAADVDTERDHWENPLIERAVRCAHNANQHFSPAMSGLGRVAYKYWRSRAKALLDAGLRDAAWSKNRWNAAILPLAELLGYRPVVIISYRHPAEVALSDMRQLKNMPSAFMSSITQTYVDALYALERYGGVVIDHAELMDAECDAWAIGLEAATGLDARQLTAVRDRKLRRRGEPAEPSSVWLPSDLRAVSQNLISQRNIAMPGARYDRERS
jgi:hypothetical protein